MDILRELVSTYRVMYTCTYTVRVCVMSCVNGYTYACSLTKTGKDATAYCPEYVHLSNHVVCLSNIKEQQLTKR